MSSAGCLVRMVGISKAYPGVKALRAVDFDLEPSEVHCLVGENGAGKSTLMRMLSGAERPDQGTIEVLGDRYPALDPSQGIELGIATIYQETDLVGSMSVANNIFLGHEPLGRWGAVDWQKLNQDAAGLLKSIGVSMPVKARVRDLSAANKQFVQIAKALSRNSRVLIMDEPGGTLNDHELEKLFGIARQLKSRGIGIIYISHRLGEVLKIGDRVTVMRQGERVSTCSVSEVTIASLIHDMVGKDLGEQFGKVSSAGSEVVLSVQNLTSERHFYDVSFDLHRGEVLGLAGLVGAGRSELLKCIFGGLKHQYGTIALQGRVVSRSSPRHAVKLGLGLVPEDRRDEGLVLIRDVAENITLPIVDDLSPRLFIDFRRVADLANKFVKRLGIVTPSIRQSVQYLSGGNQQKVVLSKWLAAGAKILLLDEPTRGVDVGAKSEIYHLIRMLTSEGISIIMASSELPEVIGMSDRILVMAEGRITKELEGGGQVTQEEIMEYAVPQRLLPEKGRPQ